MVNGLVDLEMGMVCSSGRMALSMKGNGGIIGHMGRGSLLILMGMFMMGNGATIKQTAKEPTTT